MFIRSVRLYGVLFCLLICSELASAQCKQPKDEDKPHGGKEFVLAGEGTVGRIYGSVVRKDKKVKDWVPAGDVVVELYSYSGGANREDVSKAVREQKRVAACLTGGDGKYSFSGLNPGRYAILILDPSEQESELKILLPSGT
jgi:hypothetical protein